LTFDYHSNIILEMRREKGTQLVELVQTPTGIEIFSTVKGGVNNCPRTSQGEFQTHSDAYKARLSVARRWFALAMTQGFVNLGSLAVGVKTAIDIFNNPNTLNDSLPALAVSGTIYVASRLIFRGTKEETNKALQQTNLIKFAQLFPLRNVDREFKLNTRPNVRNLL
jgi:hypothetical protein